MIKDFSTALCQNRKKEIALPKLEEELAIHPRVNIHQLDRTTQLLLPFPHTLDFHEPDVVLRAYDLPGKNILGAVETFVGRIGRA